jgi:hypothetical protein
MDGRTGLGGLLTTSGLLFAYVAVRGLRRGLAGDAGTASLAALGGITVITLGIAALGVSLFLRGRRDEPGETKA